MDFSGFWNHVLLNASTVCIGPSSLVQVLTPYAASSDTTSSQCSESTHEEEGEADEKNEPNKDDDEKSDHEQKKKSIQRIRYSKEEYRCTQCPYTCTTEKAFVRHSRFCEQKDNECNHPLSCPICGKDRRDEDTLALHMTKHKQDRHFCCDFCKFRSLQLKKLIQHRRMHTGEKPHLCPACSYRSSRRDNLRSHVRRVHKMSDLTCDTFSPRSMILAPRKKLEEV